MEATKVPLKEIKSDPLAHELATSEGTQRVAHVLAELIRIALRLIPLHQNLSFIVELIRLEAVFGRSQFSRQMSLPQFTRGVRGNEKKGGPIYGAKSFYL